MKIYCPVEDYVVTCKLLSSYKRFSSLPIENDNFVIWRCQKAKILKIQHSTTLTLKSIRSKKESGCRSETILTFEGKTYNKNEIIELCNYYLHFFKCKEAAFLYIYQFQNGNFQKMLTSQKFTGSIHFYENDAGRLSRISKYCKGNIIWQKFFWKKYTTVCHEFFYVNKKLKMTITYDGDKKLHFRKFTGGISINLPRKHQRTLPYLLQYDIYFKKMKKIRPSYKIF
jgi:hypothetical protein